MANMTYRDIPVLRSAGFKCSPSGYTWYRNDKDGKEWAVIEEDYSTLLSFKQERSLPVRLTRKEFDELFLRRN